jgi:superfamily II DNA/RNA helicase
MGGRARAIGCWAAAVSDSRQRYRVRRLSAMLPLMPRAFACGGGRVGACRAHETCIESAIFPWTDWSLMTASSPALAPVRFSDLGVPSVLSAALEQRGITTAFPIQAAALPDCLAGRDVCGKAPTGAGKTLAFGLGILSRLAATPRDRRRGRRHPSALVLVPTRELAAQIEEVVAPLATAIGARVTSIYGGVGYAKQQAALRGGIDVLVACPGRLTDLVERGWVDLSHVEVVVVDEADRMADMGFLPAVRRLVDRTSSSRQTLLFSATLDGPVDKLIRDYQRDPVRHDVELADADRGDVFHHFWRVEANDRVTVTTEVVAARGPAMVFCRTKRGADRLSARLARSGLASAAIHGDRSQVQRERALGAFRAGRLDVLVATDVAARGIHVDAVPLVVHFDPAADATDYVHRSGRTGRAGADGTVVSLIGTEHLVATKVIQRRLGLTGGVSSPDVGSLALPGTGHRARSGPARAKSATGAGTARSNRSSSRRRRWAS